MNLLLVLAVCFLSMVDVSLAAYKCYVCSGSTCFKTLPVETDFITTDAIFCRTTLSLNYATTAVSIVRDAAATCTDTSADFATGATSTLVLCNSYPSFNGDTTFAENSIGCYVCSDLTKTCTDLASNAGKKAYDATLKEVGKGCSTVMTYAAGYLIILVRARVTMADCVSSDTTTANGYGAKTICCNKDLCNDAVAAATIPVPVVTATYQKHAPKNIINAFVLISAVILAVVSK